MRRIILACAPAGVLAVPAKAAEKEPVNLSEGVYVLNTAKSVVRGARPVAEMFKVEKDKTTVIGWNLAGQMTNVVFPEPVMDGQPHPITGSPFWDSYAGKQLDPYSVVTTRYKDGEARFTTVSIFTPKTNTFTTTAVSIQGAATNLLVYEKQ
jgi:hypothetical protein